MSIEAIKEQISEQALTREEQIRLLRKIRCALLEEIHCKQQRLDQIDYLIYKLKKGGNLMNELEYGTIFEKGIPNPFGKFFVGNSYLSILTQLNGVGVANVTFEPGCRNNWHVHHGDKGGGQILLVTGGRGWYQEWGKEAQELHAGDVVAIPTGVKHWHGAAWDSWFAHVAIEIPGENTSNEWLEPVSEEDYNKLR